MLDGRNIVNITGGITRDPEIVADKIAKFSIGVDYAAADKGGSSSGYFDITYYLTGDNQRNADFVRRQISEGKMKKGSQIIVLGRLVQERWSDDNGNRSKVVIVAESLTYAQRANPDEATTSSGSASAAGEAAAIPEF